MRVPEALLSALLIVGPPAVLHAQTARERTAATEAFGWMLYLGVTSNILFEWDPDIGGYPDSFATMDKQLHAAVGYSLTQAAITAGVRPRDAVIGVSLAAVGWELSQGYSSWRDVVAGVSGSLAAWGWHELWRRRAERDRPQMPIALAPQPSAVMLPPPALSGSEH